MPSKVNTLLLVIVLVFVASLANASPSVDRFDDTGIDLSFPANADNSVRSEALDAHLTAYGSTDFSHLCADFVKPPIASDSAAASDDLRIKALPAVPGAVFMSLIGFCCVSLVRDRKFYLAIMIATLALSQAGIQSLPRLLPSSTLKKSNRGQLQFDELGLSALIGRNSRLRSDIEGNKYIGLLRHLAGIPSFSADSILEYLHVPHTFNRCSGQIAGKYRSESLSSKTTAVIPPLCNSFALLRGPAADAGLSIPFNDQGVFFENLARGPPIRA
ncbi:MAG: hypothetical protein ACYSWP_08205 [Planctomycetota bacterium]|jgi:hypothetical protein